jgi:minor extracellular serine protease Vpr
MVSGSAALVKQSNPNLTPLQIKSALVNTASLSNLTTSDGSAQASVSEVGAGLLQTQNAVVSTVQVVPSPGGSYNPYFGATISFGTVGTPSITPSGTLTIYNTGTSQVTWTMSVQQNAGYSTSAASRFVNNGSPSTVTFPAGTPSSPGQAT